MLKECMNFEIILQKLLPTGFEVDIKALPKLIGKTSYHKVEVYSKLKDSPDSVDFSFYVLQDDLKKPDDYLKELAKPVVRACEALKTLLPPVVLVSETEASENLNNLIGPDFYLKKNGLQVLAGYLRAKLITKAEHDYIATKYRMYNKLPPTKLETAKAEAWNRLRSKYVDRTWTRWEIKRELKRLLENGVIDHLEHDDWLARIYRTSRRQQRT